MAAGMHHAGIARGIVHARLFGDRQGVHVGAQPDHAAAAIAPAPDHADDAGAPDALDDLVHAEAAQQVRDLSGGAMHLVKQLGVL